MPRLGSRRQRAGASFVLFLVLSAMLAPGSALGHADLVTVVPADGATVAGPPAEIVMTFSQNLDSGRSSIRLVDAGGSVIADGGRVDPDNVRTMRLALPTPPPPGRYTLRWTSFSTEDGERHTGTTTFRIAAPTPPPASAPPAPSAAPTAAPSETAAPPASSPTSAPTYSHPPTPAPPAASTADAVLPLVVVLVVLVVLGARFLRGRTGPGA